LAAAAPEQLTAYGLPETELDAVAAVVQVGCVVSTLEVSPFTKPLIWSVSAGFASPYVRDLLSAVTVKGALPTVRLLLPVLAPQPLTAAKLAPTPVGYVFAAVVPKLTPDKDATPDAFVVADPTELPFSVKAIVLAVTEQPPDEVSVAASETLPPYVPDALATDRLVGAVAGTRAKSFEPLLFATATATVWDA